MHHKDIDIFKQLLHKGSLVDIAKQLHRKCIDIVKQLHHKGIDIVKQLHSKGMVIVKNNTIKV